jgi:hypothetical protein
MTTTTTTTTETLASEWDRYCDSCQAPDDREHDAGCPLGPEPCSDCGLPLQHDPFGGRPAGARGHCRGATACLRADLGEARGLDQLAGSRATETAERAARALGPVATMADARAVVHAAAKVAGLASAVLVELTPELDGLGFAAAVAKRRGENGEHRVLVASETLAADAGAFHLVHEVRHLAQIEAAEIAGGDFWAEYREEIAEFGREHAPAELDADAWATAYGLGLDVLLTPAEPVGERRRRVEPALRARRRAQLTAAARRPGRELAGETFAGSPFPLDPDAPAPRVEIRERSPRPSPAPAPHGDQLAVELRRAELRAERARSLDRYRAARRALAHGALDGATPARDGLSRYRAARRQIAELADGDQLAGSPADVGPAGTARREAIIESNARGEARRRRHERAARIAARTATVRRRAELVLAERELADEIGELRVQLAELSRRRARRRRALYRLDRLDRHEPAELDGDELAGSPAHECWVAWPDHGAPTVHAELVAAVREACLLHGISTDGAAALAARLVRAGVLDGPAGVAGPAGTVDIGRFASPAAFRDLHPEAPPLRKVAASGEPAELDGDELAGSPATRRRRSGRLALRAATLYARDGELAGALAELDQLGELDQLDRADQLAGRERRRDRRLARTRDGDELAGSPGRRWSSSGRSAITFSHGDPAIAGGVLDFALAELAILATGSTVHGPLLGSWRGEIEHAYRVELVGERAALDGEHVARRIAAATPCDAVQVEHEPAVAVHEIAELDGELVAGSPAGDPAAVGRRWPSLALAGLASVLIAAAALVELAAAGRSSPPTARSCASSWSHETAAVSRPCARVRVYEDGGASVRLRGAGRGRALVCTLPAADGGRARCGR